MPAALNLGQRHAVPPESSKSFRQRRQARADTAVINIAAHLHAQAADQIRVLRERNVQSRTVTARQVRLQAGAQVFGELDRAFDFRRASREVQFHQALKMQQDAHVTARLLRDDLLDGLPQAIFVRQTAHQATAEQLLGIASGLF